MEMKYYAKDVEGLRAIKTKYPGIYTVEDLYDALTRSWCLETCAPRLRHLWSPEDMTVGQCSVTAFLAQDIFGGKVYGIPLPEGGFHCYNVVGDAVFDLTSAQFHGEELVYIGNPEQFREEQFKDEEKKQRYELLCAALAAASCVDYA